jgi:small nuclear ribonucleoprotein (snRNP)-like protein
MKRSSIDKSRNNPGDFLKQCLGKSVEIKLNDNETYFKGILSCLDGTLNILLTNAKEIVKGTNLI